MCWFLFLVVVTCGVGMVVLTIIAEFHELTWVCSYSVTSFRATSQACGVLVWVVAWVAEAGWDIPRW